MAQNLSNMRALKIFQERHPQMVAELAALSWRGGLARLDVFAIKLIAKGVLYKNRRSLFCCLWNKKTAAARPCR
jgi:hypothetical protein